jgi:cell division protein FtsB
MGIFRRKKNRRTTRQIVTIPSFSSVSRKSGRRLSETRSRRLWLIGFVILIGYLFVSTQIGLWRSWSLWRMRDNLDEQRLELAAQVVDLDTRKRLLLTDTLFIERVARSEYHLSRPDETIYELTTQPEPQAP